MIRLISVITMILMPIISVSTGTTDSEAVLRSLDLIDEKGCDENGCPPGGAPFGNGSTVFSGGKR